MIIETFESGPVMTNGYLVADETGGHGIFIDAPIDAGAPMLERARALKLNMIALVSTHGHWDHIAENARLMRESGVPLWAHEVDEPWLQNPQMQLQFFGLPLEIGPARPTKFLADSDEFEVGKLRFRVLYLPGHCPGHIGLFEPKEKVLFAGDVLFAGSVGRADLPGADWETLLDSITTKLLPLGDDVTVYPGHGPATTIGRERRTNPFLR
jgi:glyoxylase-like metal-dependent hydrolase (beta-lactamase superfamily II)